MFCNIIRRSVSTLQTKEQHFLIGIHFHHIYSSKKKKEIVKQATDNSLYGAVRFGRPGRIFIQGPIERVEGFVKVVRNLHWQQMSVRMKIPIQSGFKEFVQFDDDGTLLEYMREFHMEKYFFELSGLKDWSDRKQKP
ncbi:hypothetical protein AKO1_014768 [Acrasis kona]|uniref:Uncharacterized protein n=1 Tax=Acrasis kona TaxID=1008807 RepID=A0AAW2Z464_9EUKA